jgi:hypothetical protein
MNQSSALYILPQKMGQLTLMKLRKMSSMLQGLIKKSIKNVLPKNKNLTGRFSKIISRKPSILMKKLFHIERR